MTSGELGSGTGRGLGLRVMISLEASSSANAVGGPLGVREGAVCAMVCLMPESMSSETVWGGMAEGDMAWCCGWLFGWGNVEVEMSIERIEAIKGQESRTKYRNDSYTRRGNLIAAHMYAGYYEMVTKVCGP